MNDLLPSEIIQLILSHLDHPQRTAIERVCKLFRVIHINFFPSFDRVWIMRMHTLDLYIFPKNLKKRSIKPEFLYKSKMRCDF